MKQKDNLTDLSIVSLADLFRRIPELQNVIEEYIGKSALVLNIGLDSLKEHEENERKREAYSKQTGTFQFSAPPETAEEVITHVAIYPSSDKMTVGLMESLNTPFIDFAEEIDKHSGSRYLSCKFPHPNNGIWWNSIKTYKSSYCSTSYIIPLFDKINDPIVINYMLMYTLSIIVRYLPDIWYEITLGKLNNIGNLIDYYISVFDHTTPHKMIERITEKRLHISAPGGFDSPV